MCFIIFNPLSYRLLSALSVISERPELLEKVLITREVRFVRYSYWTCSRISERAPGLYHSYLLPFLLSIFSWVSGGHNVYILFISL